MLQAFASGQVFGERFGEGPVAVVALHGWRRSSADFTAFARALGAGIVALDLPGHGASPEPPEPWGSPEYARLVAEVIEELAGPVVVIGHSFGGRVALFLPELCRDKVKALVLTGVPLLRLGQAAHRATGYRLIRALARRHLLSASVLEAARERYGSNDYRTSEGMMRAVFVRLVAEDYRAQLASLRCPVSLVWGAQDSVVPPEVASAALALIESSSLELLEGVGHLTPTEAPKALARAVAKAL